MCYLVPVWWLFKHWKCNIRRRGNANSWRVLFSSLEAGDPRRSKLGRGHGVGETERPTVSTFNHRLPTLSHRLINWWWLAGRWLFPTFQTKWHITLKLQMKLFLPPPFLNSFKSMFEIPLGLWHCNIKLNPENILFISLLKLLTMYVHFSSHLYFYKRPFLLKVRTYNHYLHLSDCIWQLVVHIGCVAFLINANRANRLILCTHHQ